ncbi:non-canonical purine NTP diphosphatase [Aureisphaera galaxeae]|uniref:non-canonical purine NTP diphosphatase n=1 Tax=Aureisphaera galaxeae TaxID=1538023 RepID=UPI002350FF74|nr:non-canonical purine NTP diphosphatase [Aureisphaera galaxeae]MDC8003708.1 non-canonical purine NTP diphosphatase [Aureisphaera galaxeae]
MKLVFATHNQHKFREVKALMPSHIELVNLTDIGCFDDIPETAETIEGNAKLKADYVRDHYSLPCFADDTGLEVTALNGAPGVYSARYAGAEKSAEANMDLLLENLEGAQDRSAQFKTVIALSMQGKEELFPGICKGEIIHERKGDQGFGYDPIFLPQGYDKTFAEMEQEEKGKISHRGRAIALLLDYLNTSV